MRLTDYTDYAIRVLMHLGSHPGKTITIGQIAVVHGISHNHLSKIVTHLGTVGILRTLRGRTGGIQLAQAPETIMLGAVVRVTEPNFQDVPCLFERDKSCVRSGRCGLKGLLSEALGAYLALLDLVPLSALLAPCASPTLATNARPGLPAA